jgi:hypothetical protein
MGHFMSKCVCAEDCQQASDARDPSFASHLPLLEHASHPLKAIARATSQQWMSLGARMSIRNDSSKFFAACSHACSTMHPMSLETMLPIVSFNHQLKIQDIQRDSLRLQFTAHAPDRSAPKCMHSMHSSTPVTRQSE